MTKEKDFSMKEHINKLVTVVIPFCEDFTPRSMLEEAIKSAESQSVPTTVEVVEDVEKKGPSWARNKGIERADTKYIALLDADDLWRSDKLQRQLKIMHETGAGLCVEGDPSRASTFVRDRLSESISCPTSTVLIDSKKVDVTFRTDMKRFEDHLFMVEAAMQAGVCLCPDLVEVRKHKGSLSDDTSLKLLHQQRLKLGKIIEDSYPEIAHLVDDVYSLSYYSNARYHQTNGNFSKAIKNAKKSLNYRFWWKPIAIIALSIMGRMYQSVL